MPPVNYNYYGGIIPKPPLCNRKVRNAPAGCLMLSIKPIIMKPSKTNNGGDYYVE